MLPTKLCVARWSTTTTRGFKGNALQAEWEYFVEEMKAARDDVPVLNYFEKRMRARDATAVRREYISMMNKTGGWNYATPGVQMATDTLNIIMKAYGMLGGEKSAQPGWSHRALYKMLKSMEDEALESPSLPNGETYAIFLTDLADQIFRGVKHGNPFREVEHCLREIDKRNLEATREVYTAVLRIHNAKQRDPRWVWRRLVTENVELDAALLRTVANSVILLQDVTMLAEGFELYTKQGSDPLPAELLVKMLQIASEVGTHDSAELITSLTETIPEATMLNKGVLRKAAETLLSHEKHPAALKILTKFAKGANDLDSSGLGVRLYVEHVLMEKNIVKFINGVEGISRHLPKDELPIPYGKIEWFAEGVKKSVLNGGLEKWVAACRVETGVGGMLAVAGYAVMGDMLNAQKHAYSTSKSILPCMALLKGFELRSHERHHEATLAFLKSHDIPIPSKCYDLVITLSCQADDLDSALMYLAEHTERNPHRPLSPTTYAHVLYSACTSADLPLTTSLLVKLQQLKVRLPVDLQEACLNVFKDVDWRGEACREFDTAYGVYTEAVLGANKSAMELSLDAFVKATQK